MHGGTLQSVQKEYDTHVAPPAPAEYVVMSLSSLAKIFRVAHQAGSGCGVEKRGTLNSTCLRRLTYGIVLTCESARCLIAWGWKLNKWVLDRLF